MTVVLYRIGVDTPDYESDDLTGKGAEKTGGRWNRVGVAMIYVSTSRALACLETVVHLSKQPLPFNRYLVELSVSDELWADASVVSAADHVGWDAEPAGRVSMSWGDSWAAAGKARAAPVLMKVPSVVIREEWNVLINPLHPDAGGIMARKIRKFVYDPRLRS